MLSIRNLTKDSVQKEFINQAKKLKVSSKSKRGSTMIPGSHASVGSIHRLRKRIKTREEKRPRNRNNLQEISLGAQNNDSKDYSKSPSEGRFRKQNKNLRIRKKRKSKASNHGFRKAQAGSRDESHDKSQDDLNSMTRESNLDKFNSQNQSFSMKHFNRKEINNLSPPENSYIQVDEHQDPNEYFNLNTPMNSDHPGIFNMNGEENSGMPINIKSSMSHFTETAQKFHKVKVIDWEESEIFQMVLDGDTELNKEKSNKVFNLEEVDYIVLMMKKRYRDFKTTDMLNPFFRKGKNTLKMLMESLELGPLFGKIDMNYSHITLEN